MRYRPQETDDAIKKQKQETVIEGLLEISSQYQLPRPKTSATLSPSRNGHYLVDYLFQGGHLAAEWTDCNRLPHVFHDDVHNLKDTGRDLTYAGNLQQGKRIFLYAE